MSYWQTDRGSNQAGLTLIEILVVVPFIILLIGTLILAITALTGESLFSQEKNNAAYNVQSALDDMENAVKFSTSFLDTADSLAAPQGQDSSSTVGDASGSSPFTYDAPDNKYDSLLLRSAATSASPYNTTRELIYTGSAPCDNQNPLYQYTTVFFVNTNTHTLYKRVILPATDIIPCKTPWQRNSCTTPTGTANCKVRDEKLLDHVDSLKIEYLPDPSSSPTTPTNATVAVITIVRATKATGEAINYSGTVHATRINSSDIGS